MPRCISDFKNHRFDTSKIVSEYLTSVSVKQTIKTNESKVKELEGQITSLQNLFSHWHSQVQIHKQAIDIFEELKAMGFGLDELKRMLSILEIAEHKNISTAESVSLFLKDAEEHYHNDLLFKDTANSKRDEIKSLNNQISQSQLILQLTPLVGPALRNLFQNRVFDQDIIEFNQLVQNYKNDINNALVDDSGGKKNNKHHKGSNLDKGGFCKSLTDELNRYGGIKRAIKEQSQKLEIIKQEVLESEKQKHEVLAYCHLAIALTNTINYKISHLKGLMDHYFKEHTQNQMKMSTQSLSPILVFVIGGKLQ